MKKIKIILMLISLSICLGLMSNTYSRYVATTTSDINASFSRWQILIGTDDITANANSTITITPVIEEQENVAQNTIAPSTTGYFDIDINPINVDVSFKYKINLSIANENMPDLIITKYAIVPEDYIEESDLTFKTITSNVITDDLYFNKTNDLYLNKAGDSFKFKPFTIRVYFEWYEGQNEEMNDAADTALGNLAATSDTKLQVQAVINFEQIIKPD